MNREQGDRFIRDNFERIGLVAYAEYLGSGRGIITLDLHGVTEAEGAAAVEMGYVEGAAGAEVEALVAGYDPEAEFVCLARCDDDIGIGVYGAAEGATFRELAEQKGGRE